MNRVVILCCIWIALVTALPPIPSAWPFSGEADGSGGASALAQVGFRIRYQYLTGDATDINSNWLTWQEPGPPYGLFVQRYISESQTAGVLPVFTYYMIVPSSPDAYNENANSVKLQNTNTMNAYYSNLKAFFQAAATYPTQKVVLHIEPDMWGNLEQVYNSDDASTMPVASSGFADVAGFANTLRGYAQAIQYMRNTYAPNVLLAYHISVWGTNTDITYQDTPFSECVTLGVRAGNYYNSLQVSYDLAFAEFTDRDAGFYERIATDSTPCAPGKAGCPHWFTEDDWTRTLFVNVTNKRLVFWQIPYGNTIMKACNNVNYHYQDTRPQWLIGDTYNRTNINRFVNIGVMGFLFGKGNENGSCSCDDAGDGITNPTPINGNIIASLTADDDGGYFINKSTAYYGVGAITLPGGSPSPSPVSPSTTPSKTPSTSVSPTRTPSVTPSKSATPSGSPSRTPSPSTTPTRTPSKSPSTSPTPSPSSSPVSPSASPSTGASVSTTPSTSPSSSSTPSRSTTPSPTPSRTSSPSSGASSSPGSSSSSSPASTNPSLSPSPSKEADQGNPKKKDNTTPIMAGVIAGAGAAAVVGLLIGAIVIRNRRKRQSDAASGMAANSVPLSTVAGSRPSHASQFVVGSPVEALYTDGLWYPASVKQVRNDGQFMVSYNGYNEDAVLPASSVRRPS